MPLLHSSRYPFQQLYVPMRLPYRNFRSWARVPGPESRAQKIHRTLYDRQDYASAEP